MPPKDKAMNIISGFFSRLGLQYKFILITTCSIIVAMGIVGYISVEREKKILYEDIEKQGRLLGETLAIPIINDLIYEKLGIVEEGGLLDNYIMEIFSRQDIALLYIAVLNEEGKVMSHNTITEYGKVYSDQLTKNSLNSASPPLCLSISIQLKIPPRGLFISWATPAVSIPMEASFSEWISFS